MELVICTKGNEHFIKGYSYPVVGWNNGTQIAYIDKEGDCKVELFATDVDGSYRPFDDSEFPRFEPLRYILLPKYQIDRSTKDEMVSIKCSNEKLLYEHIEIVARNYGHFGRVEFIEWLFCRRSKGNAYLNACLKSGRINSTDLSLLEAFGIYEIQRVSEPVEQLNIEDVEKNAGGIANSVQPSELAISEAEEIHLNSDSERMLERLDQINSNIEKLIKIIGEV